MPDLLHQLTGLCRIRLDTVECMPSFQVENSSLVPNGVDGSISYRVDADGSTPHGGYDRITVYDESYSSVFSDYTISVSYTPGDPSYDALGTFPTDLAAGRYQVCATPNDGDQSAAGACVFFGVLDN